MAALDHDDGELINEFETLEHSAFFQAMPPGELDKLIKIIKTCNDSIKIQVLEKELSVLSELTIDNSSILKYPFELFYDKLSQITQFVKGKPYINLKNINIFLALLLVVFSIDLKYKEKVVVPMIDLDIDIVMYAFVNTPGIKTQKQIDDKRKSLTTEVKRAVDLTESLAPILNIYAGMYNKHLNTIPLILTPSQDYVLTDKKIIHHLSIFQLIIFAVLLIAILITIFIICH
jgi:hypothetical protein